MAPVAYAMAQTSMAVSIPFVRRPKKSTLAAPLLGLAVTAVVPPRPHSQLVGRSGRVEAACLLPLPAPPVSRASAQHLAGSACRVQKGAIVHMVLAAPHERLVLARSAPGRARCRVGVHLGCCPAESCTAAPYATLVALRFVWLAREDDEASPSRRRVLEGAAAARFCW